jgi:hypothetical protein
MKKIFLFLLLLPVFLFAQTAKTEITKSDITLIKNFSGDKVSVFGVYLGMNKVAAKKALQERTDILFDVDLFNSRSDDPAKNTELRLYVYEKNDAGEKGESLAYIMWDEGAAGITQITVFKNLLGWVKGNTENLFKEYVSNANSSFMKKLLGKPSKVDNGPYIQSNIYAARKFKSIKYKGSSGYDYYFALITKEN